MNKLLLLVVVLVCALQACYYDKESDLYPFQLGCDTLQMKYSVQVSQVISRNCVSCHSSSAASGGIALETYEQVKAGMQNGSLLRAVKHQGGSPMPKNAPKLGDCEINQLEAWKNAGCPNN